MAEYSFTPQFANLTGLQPISAIDVTRGGELQFQPLQAIQVPSAQPELVGQGISNALQSISQGLFGGITAKYEEKKALEKEEREHERALELAGAKEKSENQKFFERQLAAFDAENMGRIDYPEKRANFIKSYSGIMGRLPEIERKETEPPTKPPPSDVEADALALDTEPLPQPDLMIPQAEVQTAVAAAEKPLAPLVPPTTAEPAAKEPLLAEVQVPEAAPTPTPVPIAVPKQPEDPAAPRIVPTEQFKSEVEASRVAYEINQTSPISKVAVKQNPATGGYNLIQQPAQTDIKQEERKEATELREQEKIRLQQEEFNLKKAAEAREIEKTNTEKLAKDEAYLAKMKNAIQTNGPTLQTIDRVISLVEKYQDDFLPIVGLRSQFLTGDLGPLGKAGVALLGGQASEDALVVRELIEAFKAPSRWNGLMALKEISPTGASGAGALSNVEGDSLERLQGSLNPSIMRSDEIIDRLYYIRNAAIKATMNAYKKIQKVDPTYAKPFSPKIVVNPKIQQEYNEIYSKLKNANEDFKKTQEYKDLFDRGLLLREEIKKAEDANKFFFE